MIDKTNYYFTNPKYTTNHFCVQLEDGSYGVFEKSKYDGVGKVYLSVIMTGTPRAKGDSVESAICSAEKIGIKHYDVEIVVVSDV